MGIEREWMLATDASLERLSSCFARSGSPKDMDVLRWQYLNNPAGGPIVSFATDRASDTADQLAAIYAVFPVRMRIGQEMTVAVQSLDTLTDAQYRGQGLFGKMATDVYERCRTEGISNVYGFPNGNSAPGFFGRLSWKVLDPVPFLIKPLRLGYFLSKLPGLARLAGTSSPRPPLGSRPALKNGLERLNSFGPETDALWKEFVGPNTVAVERDSTYLNWRFLSKPQEDYVVIAHRNPAGVMDALSVHCIKDKHGGRICYVMELLIRPGADQAGLDCLNYVTACARDAKCDAMLAWNLLHSPNHRTFARARFFVMPERIRPIELHFGARAFADRWAAPLSNRINWYLSYCDSDTV